MSGERGGGLAVSVVLLIFVLNWGVPHWYALHPPFGATALLAFLGAPAFAALTAVLRGITPARDGLRLYVAEVFSLGVTFLAFPLIWVIIVLQMVSGVTAIICVAVLAGLLACVVQNLLHAHWGLMRSWSDIAVMALGAGGLLIASLPVMVLASKAEEASMDLYPWMVEKIRRIERRVQAGLFSNPNPPDSFTEEDEQ